MEVTHKAHSPDSTTKEKPVFTEGEEVLVRMKEGRFFLGTVNQINAEDEKCLIKFADNTELWTKFVDITSTAVSEVDDVMCVMCKSSFSKPNNTVMVCKSCSRGYHQLCHKPAVKEISSKWECKRCSQNSPSSSKHITKTKSHEKSLPSSPSELPYDPASLVWYMQHRFNTQQTYCYCGQSGEWYLKMLQCLRCLQWYHEKCIQALCYPLYIGDRFYIYICSVCNKGNEFLRRVEFSWTDLVHLLLFNLTAYKAKNRFSEEDIVEYANLHWPFLQLPPKIFKVLESYRKDYILESLRKSSRFKFANKNGTAGWGLRLRVPPSVPTITVPTRSLSDQSISQLLAENDRLKNVKFFISPSRNMKLTSPEEIRTIPTSGLNNLHVDRSALSLPKGISTTGHNVCIKSASPFYPESKAVILRKIKQQQGVGSGSRNSTASGSQQCEPIKIRVKTNKLENSHEVAEITGGSESLPPTPPYSVSAPNTPTPDTSNTDAQNLEEDNGLEEDLSVPPTPADSSGDEATDVNPCETRTNKSLLQLLGHREETKPTIALPLPLNPVITQPQVKPVKRRLSEKDIRVNRNGEVKRRRIRRQCTLQQPKLEPIASGSASAQLMSSEYSHVSYSASPYSNEDLRAAVYEYFSASNRIAMGERFRIRGKRVLSNGKVQWLIEWKSCLT